MQCACPECQILMSWVEKGLDSCCKCPNCDYKCAACMGTNSVLSIEELKRRSAAKLEEDPLLYACKKPVQED